jgi:arginyl-tRNA synthetase
LWNKGKDLPQLRFVKHDDERSTLARLALLGALKAVLASGLGTLGVGAPDEMR